MPTNRRKVTRKKRLDPDLCSYFAFLGGAQMLIRKHGENYLKQQWAIHGRAFLDSWTYDSPPLILKIYGEPENITLNKKRRLNNGKHE